MTRADQLRWWRQGYDTGFAAGRRQQAHHQAVIDALLLDTIDILARALLGKRNQPEDDNGKKISWRHT